MQHPSSKNSQKIGPDEVKRVARLARLALSDQDVPRFAHQIDAILEYVSALSEVNVDGIEPTFHAIVPETRWTPDVVVHALSRDEVLAQAPASAAGGFAVPRVMEGES